MISEDCVLKIIPAVLSLLVVLIGWGASVEVRVNSISAIQADRAPKIAKLEASVSLLDAMVRDPSPKAETKVEIDAMRNEHRDMHSRVDRIEDRLNNLHNFMLNAAPKLLPRRGYMPPFKPEWNG